MIGPQKIKDVLSEAAEELLEYAVARDAEGGGYRTAEELVSDWEVPLVYEKIIELLTELRKEVKNEQNAGSVGVIPMGLLAEHFWSFDWPWEMTRLRDWFYMVKFKGHIVPTTNFAHCYTHIRVLGFYSRWKIRILLKDA